MSSAGLTAGEEEIPVYEAEKDEAGHGHNDLGEHFFLLRWAA